MSITVCKTHFEQHATEQGDVCVMCLQEATADLLAENRRIKDAINGAHGDLAEENARLQAENKTLRDYYNSAYALLFEATHGADLVNAELQTLRKDNDALEGRKNRALEIIIRFGGIDGSHHKQWVLDQVVRILTDTDKGYAAWILEYEDGDDGPDTYRWDKGIAP